MNSGKNCKSLLKKNLAFFIPYFLFLVTGGVLLILFNETDIHLYINSRNNHTADIFFSKYTHLGLAIMIIPVALILAFVRLRYMLISIIGFLTSASISGLIKVAFHAPRPVIVFAQMHQSLHLVPGVHMNLWDSFPSGHTTTSFCMFCLLALYTRNNALKLFYFMVALLIAYSRMYLSQHFLKDVYAGSIVGVGSAVFTYYWVTNAQMLDSFAERLDEPLIKLK